MKNISLDKFSKLKAKVDYESVVRKYAKKTKDTLVSASPKSNRPNRRTPYAQGWTVDDHKGRKELKCTVWNETNWQLTHLLENGHFIVNQGALSWASPRKHIKQTYLKVRDPFIREMGKVKIDIDIK